VLETEVAEVWAARQSRQPEDETDSAQVQGGRARGLVLHKLLEEVLTGEASDDHEALKEQASMLIRELGEAVDKTQPKGCRRRSWQAV
jgi:exodeoxyribonuclease-5